MTGRLVSAPASSANLGPGFDTLGLALDLPFDLALSDDLADGTAGSFLVAEGTHPAVAAYVRAGGDPGRKLSWRSPIPPGRGLGFSGAARVAGAYLGAVVGGAGDAEATDTAFRVATEMEGHADNAAASSYGGLCVAGDFGAVAVPTPPGLLAGLRVVVWSPDTTTSTRSARTRLPDQVPLAVAVGSIERTALWVAAMAGGRVDLLREACIDEIHQPSRLRRVPGSAEVLEGLLSDERVVAAWLSGSGPTVAAMVPAVEADAVAGALTASDGSSAAHGFADDRRGRVRVLGIAPRGVHSTAVVPWDRPRPRTAGPPSGPNLD